VLQRNEVPPPAVRVAEAPTQMIPSSFATPEFSVTEIVAVGKGLTVIVEEAVPVHPDASVTVTVYTVVIPGATTMD
jgi:hypothetical protein